LLAAYFCTMTVRWRPRGYFGVWAVSTLRSSDLPRIPLCTRRYGFIRDVNEIWRSRVTARSWAQVSGDVWFWRALCEGAVFPNLTAILMVCVAAAASWECGDRLGASVSLFHGLPCR
jgi:hypothetical protein